MNKNNEKSKTNKHLCKVNKKWVAVATTSAALLGVGGIFPGIAGPGFETETVQAADEESNVSEWTANTVNEVEQEVEAQNSVDTSSYQIRWGDTLSALSMATGVSVDEIAVQNDIENPDLIYAGDFLSGETNNSQPTEEIDRQEASETEKTQTGQAVEEVVEEEIVEEQPEETPAVGTEETSGAEEEVEEQTIEEQPQEAPAEESEETTETVEEETTEQTASVEDKSVEEPTNEPADESAEEAGETVESEETSEEEPVAKVELPKDTDEEEVEEEDVPEKIAEEVDVQEVTTTGETVEPNDEVVTDQSVAVVTEPESSENFIQPAQGYLSSEYGYRANPFGGRRRLHAGIDIAGSGPISAAQSGTVVAAQYHSGWGNYVKIDHGNGYETLYAHMENGSIPVSVGETVSQGQTIGTMGQTGSATGVHLHFEVYVNGIQVDPIKYL